ncbi:hypothetical protein MLD38_011670 [Melastoma candidum]|uniref:Uncharacterized protein n=1 Tax=Melastoma candidum TaxID=119954 RepID=A0ACB9R3U4_9MYRT|nr:hypothetical protein MLD38_011670 [Melastoma candidum]
MEHDRLNSPETSAICLEVRGHQLQFAQDPNSKHLGTTVWDSSMVLVKFLEKNSRKGKFCPSKLKGKRVIELGAGCGVAGFGMALLGCDVVATDQVEVLPLLMRNVERNTSRVLQTDPAVAESFGSIQVAELDWGNEKHIEAADPPFDYIIGTDVVYAEHLLEPLLNTIRALAGPKTIILLGYEIRSTNVHEQMLEMWRNNFNLKTVPRHKMHSEYQHNSIHLYIMDLKTVEQCEKTDAADEKAQSSDQTPGTDAEAVGSPDDSSRSNDAIDEDYQQALTKLKEGDLSEWEVRRYGSMAARLLRDAQIA